MRDLLPYQVPVLERFLDSDTMGLQLQMRLGKTIITSKWMMHRKFKKPLVLCPISAMEEWKLNVPHITTLTYQKVTRNLAILKEDWDCLVLDESSHIKNAKSKITKAILKTASRFRGRAILTGILSPEKLSDVYPQMAFLIGGSFMGCNSYWGWRETYFIADGYDWIPKLGTIPEIRKSVAVHCAILSRKEAGVGSTKERISISVPMSSSIREVYSTLRKDWALPNGITTKHAPVKVAWLHRASGGHHKPYVELECAKYDRILDLAKEFPKLVVWCAYSLELCRLWKHLKNFNKVFVQGGTPKPRREERRQKFFDSKSCVFVAQPVCARFGLDLSCADAAVYLSCPWSHNTRLQSEDRIIHPMKTAPVKIFDLVMRDSIDQEVIDAVLEKRDVTRAVIGAGYLQSFQ